MADGFVLEIPEMVGIALAAKRSAQAATNAWPQSTLIISADSHMLESDCWVDRFPEHLKDQAPRMAFVDGGWRLSVAGRPMTPPQLAADLCMTLECTPGFTDVQARLADLDHEGIDQELIFGNAALAMKRGELALTLRGRKIILQQNTPAHATAR